VRVHFSRKHALELEPFDFRGQLGHIGFDFGRGLKIGLLGGEFEKLPGILEAAGQLVQGADDLFQFGAFPPQLLGALGVVPDARLFEFPVYFLEAFVFVVVIKDTSSRNRCVPRDL